MKTGENYYLIGKKIFIDSALNFCSFKDSKQKIIEALYYFDKAIENGYEDSDVFDYRGNCLRELGYDLNALEDFNKCITIHPTWASYYYERAMTKRYMLDFDGAIYDLKIAIKLSRLDNEDTRSYAGSVRKFGFETLTQKYESDLQFYIHDTL